VRNMSVTYSFLLPPTAGRSLEHVFGISQLISFFISNDRLAVVGAKSCFQVDLSQ
jgi:hypothetical protein